MATRDSLDIKLLGELEVWIDGDRISIGDRRHRVVLGILLLDPGRAIQTDRIADLVWLGEESPRTARNAIQVSVSRLRAALGDAAPIVRTGDGYAIDVPRSAIDLFRFRDLLPDVGGTPAATVELLSRACQLWRGPVLDGTFTDEFAESAVQRHRRGIRRGDRAPHGDRDRARPQRRRRSSSWPRWCVDIRSGSG